MLRNMDIKDPTTNIGRLFRRRFRVPFPIYEEILVPRCRESNLFDVKSEDSTRIPLEFKILISLRILGRGNPAYDIAEIAQSFESTALKVITAIKLSHLIVCQRFLIF